MNCEECAEELTSLVFDEISDEKALTMHEHIADCDACRDSYIELVDTQFSLKSVLTENLPLSGLGESQKKEILAQAAPSGHHIEDTKKPLVFPSWLMAVAACLLIGVIVINNSQHSKEANVAKSEEKAKNEVSTDSKKALENAPEKKSSLKMKDEVEEMELAKGAASAEEKLETLAVKEEAQKEAPKLLSEKSEKSLRKVKQDVKNEAEPLADIEGTADKTRGAETKKAKAPAIQSYIANDTNALAGQAELLEFAAFTKMLEEFSRNDNLKDETRGLVEKLMTLKNEQIQLSPAVVEKPQNSTEKKILVRILDNAKKAIDYAHIFVHNQKIIRVERVR